MTTISTSRLILITCGNRNFPESAQNRVHFPECGAFRKYRQIDIVASTDRRVALVRWADGVPVRGGRHRAVRRQHSHHELLLRRPRQLKDPQEPGGRAVRRESGVARGEPDLRIRLLSGNHDRPLRPAALPVPPVPASSGGRQFSDFLISFVTLSFLITTPECWVPPLGDAQHGFPYLSGAGRLVIKDAIMMGAALVTMADSAKAYLRKRASSLTQSKVVMKEERLLTASVR